MSSWDWNVIIDKILNWIGSVGIKLLWAIVVIVVSRILFSIIIKQINREGKKPSKIDPTVKNFIVNSIKVVFIMVTAVIIVTIVGIPMASFVALLATVGGAIALAMQGALSNVAAGVVLMMCKPLSVSDWIQVDEYSGETVKIALFYTTIKTIDGCNVQIPNSQLLGKVIVNQSSNRLRMGTIILPVPYGTDVEALKPALKEKASSHEFVSPSREVDVRLTDFENSSMTVSVFYWVHPSKFRKTKLDLTEQLKAVLDEHEISIPFPQLDVHMK